MNILVIQGSPKREGGTAFLVEKYLEPYNDLNYNIDRVFLRGLNISPCTACDYCQEKGVCIIQDDMQDIYQKIANSDMIIMATPIYFNSVSAWMKIMIDRCQVYWSKKFVLNDRKKRKDKLGVFICTAGVKHDESSIIGAVKVVDLFFKSIDSEYIESICIDNTDKFPVASQNEKLKEVITKAKTHILLLKEKHNS